MKELENKDPCHEAWLTSFFDVNHLNYATSPDLVASPAQLEFMVSLEPGELYYPCSERVFREIMGRVNRPFLRELYNAVWSRIFRVVEKKMEDPALRAYLTELLNIKFEQETANYNVIPSRLACWQRVNHNGDMGHGRSSESRLCVAAGLKCPHPSVATLA